MIYKAPKKIFGMKPIVFWLIISNFVTLSMLLYLLAEVLNG